MPNYAELNTETYQSGIKVSDEELAKVKIRRDKFKAIGTTKSSLATHLADLVISRQLLTCLCRKVNSPNLAIELRRMTCCPSMANESSLLAGRGPYFSVLGAIRIDRPEPRHSGAFSLASAILSLRITEPRPSSDCLGSHYHSRWHFSSLARRRLRFLSAIPAWRG